jgi:hypothetical protein
MVRNHKIRFRPPLYVSVRPVKRGRPARKKELDNVFFNSRSTTLSARPFSSPPDPLPPSPRSPSSVTLIGYGRNPLFRPLAEPSTTRCSLWRPWRSTWPPQPSIWLLRIISTTTRLGTGLLAADGRQGAAGTADSRSSSPCLASNPSSPWKWTPTSSLSIMDRALGITPWPGFRWNGDGEGQTVCCYTEIISNHVLQVRPSFVFLCSCSDLTYLYFCNEPDL